MYPIPRSRGDVRGQGVDRLEAAVADVREPLQAVDEDLVHMRRASPVVIHAEGVHEPPDIGLGSFRDETVVEGEGERLHAHGDELAQHETAVFAAAQQHDAVVRSLPVSLHLRDENLEVIR